MASLLECPCKNCICVPVCRNKGYVKVFIECGLIADYIPNFCNYDKRDQKRLEELRDTLTPNFWKISRDPEEIKKVYNIKNEIIIKDIKEKGFYYVLTNSM